MNDPKHEQQKDGTANAVLGCDELGEYYPSDDPMADPVNQQIFEEDMDRRLSHRDIAEQSLMEAAAAMRSARPKLGLYQLHACLDDHPPQRRPAAHRRCSARGRGELTAAPSQSAQPERN